MPKPTKPKPPPLKSGAPKPIVLGDHSGTITPIARQEHKPMPHADSPELLTSSDEFKAVDEHMNKLDAAEGKPPRGPMFDGPSDAADFWTCPHDGQRNKGKRCTTCGTVKA